MSPNNHPKTNHYVYKSYSSCQFLKNVLSMSCHKKTFPKLNEAYQHPKIMFVRHREYHITTLSNSLQMKALRCQEGFS